MATRPRMMDRGHLGTLTIASDGAGTIDIGGRPYMRQKLAPKLHVGIQTLVGMTGPYSLAQQWYSIVEET
jgi:hypothetical protein